jgi:hypothetical protein
MGRDHWPGRPCQGPGSPRYFSLSPRGLRREKNESGRRRVASRYEAPPSSWSQPGMGRSNPGRVYQRGDAVYSTCHCHRSMESIVVRLSIPWCDAGMAGWWCGRWCAARPRGPLTPRCVGELVRPFLGRCWFFFFIFRFLWCASVLVSSSVGSWLLFGGHPVSRVCCHALEAGYPTCHL